ncbi:hypothetical protein [Massilia antarctica]|uniref:hypothetical protein n=1 Tax=Massilia antarctica TaxID=2765360 RepID=UPI002271B13C|nr:hypothetical protein [Massilia sp. H27-R4]MCY0910880.1 hypothetical protein [Massilia sp. H27-R4]
MPVVRLDQLNFDLGLFIAGFLLLVRVGGASHFSDGPNELRQVVIKCLLSGCLYLPMHVPPSCPKYSRLCRALKSPLKQHPTRRTAETFARPDVCCWLGQVCLLRRRVVCRDHIRTWSGFLRLRGFGIMQINVVKHRKTGENSRSHSDVLGEIFERRGLGVAGWHFEALAANFSHGVAPVNRENKEWVMRVMRLQLQMGGHCQTCYFVNSTKQTTRKAIPMANNFLISYDLISPGQRYDLVADAIKQCGPWAKVEFSLYYVNSPKTCEDVAKHVWGSMTANDKLMVLDASNNNFFGYNIDPIVLKLMQDQWYR